MATALLTRAEYDLLVTYASAWLAAHWAEYRKQWYVGGVMVCAEQWRIENLLIQLQGVRD